MLDHLELAAQPGQGLVYVIYLVAEADHLALGVGRLDDHRRSGLASLEDDGPQLLDRLLHAVQAFRVMLVQGLVERHLGEGGGGGCEQPPRDQGRSQPGGQPSFHRDVYCAPCVITVRALRSRAQASSPVPVSMGFSLP